MNLDLPGYRISVVLSPMDMRRGFRSLSAVADVCLGIDVRKGKDVVVFMSLNRALCKAIWADAHGTCLLSRSLHAGRFQRLLARVGDGASLHISRAELLSLLDGESIQNVRSGIFSKI
jgi:transposase